MESNFGSGEHERVSGNFPIGVMQDHSVKAAPGLWLVVMLHVLAGNEARQLQAYGVSSSRRELLGFALRGESKSR
jgi:hypothetical protein